MRKLVAIESPFDAANGCSIKDHLTYARRCMHDSIHNHNEAPIASHLLYTQPGILDDNVPGERTLGMECGFDWNTHAETVLVYEDYGISDGMLTGILRARARKQPVAYRKIGRNGSSQNKQPDK